MLQLSCCGTKSYHDWINTTYSMSRWDSDLSLSPNMSISASLCRTPAVSTMWLVVGGGFSTLMHIKFVFLKYFYQEKYISVLQANMKVHSQGCLEVVTHHMRDNITTLVGLIVATLFLQVVWKFFLTPPPS